MDVAGAAVKLDFALHNRLHASLQQVMDLARRTILRMVGAPISKNARNRAFDSVYGILHHHAMRNDRAKEMKQRTPYAPQYAKIDRLRLWCDA